MDLSLSTWLLVSLPVFLAFSLKAITGFGENLIMIPILSLFMPLTIILPATLIVVLVADGYLLYQTYPDIDWHEWKRLSGPAVIGVIIGATGLTVLKPAMLKQILGWFVVTYAIYGLLNAFKRQKLSIPHYNLGYFAGFSGGLFSGLTGIGGPPVIAYLSARQTEKWAFRATCVMTFLVFDMIRLGSYASQTFFSFEIVITGLSMIPAFLLGTGIGFYANRFLPENAFQVSVLILLLIIGLSLITRSALL